MNSAEQSLLRPADLVVSRAADEVAAGQAAAVGRLTVLEEVAALHGGWSSSDYRAEAEQANAPAPQLARPWAEKILTALGDLPMPVPLALAALAREPLTTAEQRTTGAYYTDWRLAQMLARASVPQAPTTGPWIDPACGSGILLAAAALECPAGAARDKVIAERLCGADLSPVALRGTLLSVAATTGSIDAITAFRKRLLLQDSLRSAAAWQHLAPVGAALVIGNPPWEKLKTTRHEVAASAGQRRHYGQSFDSEVDVSAHRSRLLDYVEDVVTGTRLQGRGEHDLYKLFLELGLGLAAEDGVLAMLVPAGLIRAQGTEVLRRELLACASDVHVAVIENRRRHFAIDTRFKFLSVVAQVGAATRRPIKLSVADRSGDLPARPVSIGRARLAQIRPDLSLPEIRTTEEWELFARLTANGVTVGDPSGPWRPKYLRELDMTNDAHRFQAVAGKGLLPVLEGRHVHQFRCRAKAYRHGQGRAAIWDPLPVQSAELIPQWYVAKDDLRPATRARASASRIGFCDITGQTNERSLLAARIPAGVVCGNKVPTLSFPDKSPEREDLFLALINSLPVDWMLRRMVTTTVNFFILNALPLPRVEPESSAGQELISLTRSLTAAEASGAGDPWELGQLRARIDAVVATSWGLDPDQLRLVLTDFPLLDRGQPVLPGELRSTVTADCVLASLDELRGSRPGESADRAARARAIGARPYIPADYVRI